MGTPLVAPSHLSPTTASRVAACGHELVYHRPSGPTPGRWCCGSSWCQWCAAQRRARASTLIAKRIKLKSVVLLTLSIPHRADYSAEYLAHQVKQVAACWRGAMSRVRWNTWHQERGHQASVRPPGRGGPHPKYSTTWNRRSGRWSSDLSAGVWGREVTPGDRVKGWHVHVHVVLPDRAAAELLNAAWQEEVADRGLVHRGRWVSTDIREMPGTQAGYYVSKYITKKEIENVPREHHGEYVRGARHMRRCDAWGEWRPIGLSRRNEGDATHVSQPGWEFAVELATYYGEDESARAMRLGFAPTEATIAVSGYVHENTARREAAALEALTGARLSALRAAIEEGIAVPVESLPRGPTLGPD